MPACGRADDVMVVALLVLARAGRGDVRPMGGDVTPSGDVTHNDDVTPSSDVTQIDDVTPAGDDLADTSSERSKLCHGSS